jgi:hypothetical protein
MTPDITIRSCVTLCAVNDGVGNVEGDSSQDFEWWTIHLLRPRYQITVSTDCQRDYTRRIGAHQQNRRD